jgi:hypothetical protein
VFTKPRKPEAEVPRAGEGCSAVAVLEISNAINAARPLAARKAETRVGLAQLPSFASTMFKRCSIVRHSVGARS